MSIVRVSVTTIALIVLLAQLGFAQTNRVNQTIYFLNDGDNALAASKLLSGFKASGEDASKFGESDKMIIWKTKKDGNFILEPKTSTDSVDRIIVTKYYRVKFKYKNSDVMKELVWQANRKFNAPKFSLDSDGDLEVQGYVCFLDSLDMKLLKAFCSYLNSVDFVALAIIDQNAMEYFE